MVRALLEGVLLNLRSILLQMQRLGLLLMRRSGLAFDTVRVSGGATALPLWLQLLAEAEPSGRRLS